MANNSIVSQLKSTTTKLKITRGIFVAGYVSIVILCFTTPWGPRIFWTMALPALILAIVLMGFYTWRNICPLAFWGSLGLRLKSKQQAVRRVPPWLEQWFFVIQLGFLISMLIMRLTVINGDGFFLGLTLIMIAIFAASTNYLFTGKTWCNFICPVGVVERIYTEPNSLRTITTTSQCGKCTACKKNCPDIDQEAAYWKDNALTSRKIAYYIFPGVVLGFYSYYFLRAGTWEAYYGGAWTHKLASLDLLFGSGFYFAPNIPALLAATLTMLGFCAVSFGIFFMLERIIGRLASDLETKRHLTLTLSAFVAFNIFYLFAGAPTLRLIPGGTRVMAFVAPLASTLFLIKRWRRESGDYIKEKSARKLLKDWNFKEPPPKNPAEIFAFFKGRENAHETQLAAYRDALHEMLSTGGITSRELNLLDQLRNDLGITETEHRKIFIALSEEDKDRLDPKQALRAEQRLQLEGYQAALSAALMRNASLHELADLQTEYGIDTVMHESLLADLHGDASPLREKIQRWLNELYQCRARMRSLLSISNKASGVDFALFLLLKAQDRLIENILEALMLLKHKEPIFLSATEFFHQEEAVRQSVMEQLRDTGEMATARQLEIISKERIPTDTASEPLPIVMTVSKLWDSYDPYQRAAAVLLVGQLQLFELQKLVANGLSDENSLVRESAKRASVLISNATSVALLEAQGMVIDDFGTIEKILFLRGVSLFAQLEPAELHKFSQLTRQKTIFLPDALCLQGELSDDLYILTAGRAVVSVVQNGKEKTIAHLKPGDVVGEVAAIDHSPRTATVRPEAEPLQTLQISGTDFRYLLTHTPEIATAMLMTISQRMRHTMDNLSI